jgi:hypothetical protein
LFFDAVVDLVLGRVSEITNCERTQEKLRQLIHSEAQALFHEIEQRFVRTGRISLGVPQ